MQLKNLYIASIITLYVCLLSSCYKDKGSYEYSPINELSFSGIESAKGYSVDYGQRLSIVPQVIGSLDPDGSKLSYSYEWSLDLPLKDSVISNEKSLNVAMNVSPGNYTLLYKVKDNGTGVVYRAQANLLVKTKVFEGFLVMNEVRGQTRLDMLSYYRTDDKFTQLTDVLTEMGSPLKLQGKPLNVFCIEMMTAAVATPKSYRIYLSTENQTERIDPETFGHTELLNLRYEMTGTVPSGFKATKFTGGANFLGLPYTLMSAGNNVFQRLYADQTFAYIPMNIYTNESTPFRAFPAPIYNNSMVVIYNMDKRVFTTANANAVKVTDAAPALNYPTGKDMVFMDWNTSGKAHAILKDPGISSFHLLRFTPGSARDYFEPLVATDIDKASCFAFSPDQGYLFYSVAGKVYEYDLFLKTSKLMADKGNSVVSYLSFQRFFKKASFAKYAEWEKLLNIGYYDPSKAEGTNGTLEQYAVPPTNGQIQLRNSWTGFGKIVSIAYRER